jgi:hypothetical protein
MNCVIDVILLSAADLLIVIQPASSTYLHCGLADRGLGKPREQYSLDVDWGCRCGCHLEQLPASCYVPWVCMH